jgi:hypothetical protein
MTNVIGSYKGWWDIYDSLPDGWRVDPSKTGSPIHDCVFITSGKSVFDGGKRALLKVDKKPPKQLPSKSSELPDQPLIVRDCFKQDQKPLPSADDLAQYPMVINRLAREKFKQKLLQELVFDFKVCQLEGWSCFEYPYSLKVLIDEVVSKMEIATKARISESRSLHEQLSLF